MSKKILLFAGILLFFSIFSHSVSATWWNATFNYKIPITITNPQANYQIPLNLTYNTNYKNSDCSDIRFVNSSENEQYDFWVENYTANWCYVWVEMKAATDFYLYYGNASSVESQSNGTNTFLAFSQMDTGITDWAVGANDALAINTTNFPQNFNTTPSKNNASLAGKRQASGSWYVGNKTVSLTGNWSATFWRNPYNGGYIHTTAFCGSTAENCFELYCDVQTNKWSYDGIAGREGLGGKCVNNNWYKVEFQFDVGSKKGRIYIYNSTGLTAWNGGVFNITQYGTAQSAFNKVLLSYSNQLSNITLMDGLFIRNLTSPEPTYSIGSEQSNNDATFNISMPANYNNWQQITGTTEGTATALINWISFNYSDSSATYTQPYDNGSSSYAQSGSLQPILRITNTGNAAENFSLKLGSALPSGITISANVSCSGTSTSCTSTITQLTTSYQTFVVGLGTSTSFANVTLYSNLTAGTPRTSTGFTLYINSSV